MPKFGEEKEGKIYRYFYTCIWCKHFAFEYKKRPTETEDLSYKNIKNFENLSLDLKFDEVACQFCRKAVINKTIGKYTRISNIVAVEVEDLVKGRDKFAELQDKAINPKRRESTVGIGISVDEPADISIRYEDFGTLISEPSQKKSFEKVGLGSYSEVKELWERVYGADTKWFRFDISRKIPYVNDYEIKGYGINKKEIAVSQVATFDKAYLAKWCNSSTGVS